MIGLIYAFSGMNSTLSSFGKTDLKIPPIVYGTSFLGNLYRDIGWEMKLEIIRQWFEASDSMVVIDTAGKYGAGLALEVIGKGLAELDIPPDKILISNKLGWYRIPLKSNEPTFEPGAWANLKFDAKQNIGEKGILDCWKQGNDLLGDNYSAQLISVHDPDEYLAASVSFSDREKRKNDIVGAYHALFDLKKRGEIRAVGIGAKDWGVIQELYKLIPFDWVMLANSLTVYRHPPEILEFIHQLSEDGVGIINSAIFNAGFLSGGEYFDYTLIDPLLPADQERIEWRNTFFKICRKFNIEPGDACLQYAMAPEEIQAVALNPSKPERIKRNTQIIEKPLPVEFWKSLQSNGIIQKIFRKLL